jgi:CspA family cold shock protein
MTTESFIGRVKWFNNKTGYGFITVTDGQRSGNDIFVHHSAINVEGQYKYLVQGEYVEFTIVDTPSGKHTCQAGSVNGIKGGKLMCTTRHETNVARSAYKKATTTVAEPVAVAAPTTVTVPKQDKPARKPRAPKPVENQGEWTEVKSTKPKPRAPRAKKEEAK